MTTQTKIHSSEIQTSNPHPLSLFSRDQVKALAAMLLVGTGVFFALAFAGMAKWTSPWWVMYLAIPSLMLVVTGVASILQNHKANAYGITNTALGLLGLAISYVMITDPTWSFIREMELDRYFPVLRRIRWDPVWQWLLVVAGAASILAAALRRTLGFGIFGALLIVVGGTFLLKLHWDAVWPWILVALGAGLLAQLFQKK